MRVFLGAGVCLVLVGAGLGVTAAPAAACPYGTVPSHFEGVCVSGPAGAQMTPPIVSSTTGSIIGGGVNQLPTVRGIPCTPEKIGTCIGLIQSQG
ncbi:MAG: hypothetical protein ACKOB8_07730 [Mycobacterium sp.]